MVLSNRAHDPGRRAFLRASATGVVAWLGAAGGAGLSSGCGSGIEVSPEELEALERFTREELERSGRGPLGPLRYRGYRGLAELPFFELRDGALVLADESVPAGIDVHTHLGMAHALAPAIDLNAASERVVYHLDCDAVPEGCPLDLDVYMNLNFTAEQLRALRTDAVRQATIGSRRSPTHTLPNLAAELDRMGFEKAVVLPIALGLPRGDATDAWLDAIDASADPTRFVRGGSVRPGSDDVVSRLESLAARGVRVLKLHPEAQRFRPDAPELQPIYAACERLGIVVIFHSGRSGIEPEMVRPYALPRHFAAVLRDFPRLWVVLGHGGAREWPEMVRVARDHPNGLFGTASLGATAIQSLLADLGPERLVFGSDWPFYPLSSGLAKLLLATPDPAVRHLVLRGNLLHALGDDSAPS